MDVRYEGGANGEPDLVLTDNPALISGTASSMGRLTTLLQWHTSDPVDEAERRRNDLIFARYQHNRNPFVDRPEWAQAVFAPVLIARGQETQLILEWTWSYTNVSLERANQVDTAWSRVQGAPLFVNGRWQVVANRSTTPQFFRLRAD
jgi:hypothetical protein